MSNPAVKSPEEYNPFAMMVEFKMFKEFTVPIVENPIQRSFIDNLEKLELTEEFKAFALGEHYSSHRGPDDNMYTLNCIYRYLHDKQGLVITGQYVQNYSVTPNQVLEISRILKHYFIMHYTKQEAINGFTKYLTDEAQKMELTLHFDGIREMVLEILHDEYTNTGMKKVYKREDDDGLLKRK